MQHSLLRNHSHIQDGKLWRSYSKKLLFADASSGMKLLLCLSRVVYIDDHLHLPLADGKV